MSLFNRKRKNEEKNAPVSEPVDQIEYVEVAVEEAEKVAAVEEETQEREQMPEPEKTEEPVMEAEEEDSEEEDSEEEDSKEETQSSDEAIRLPEDEEAPMPQGIGQPVSRPMNGQPMPPRPMNGQPVPPRPMNGQPMPPRPMNGQPMPPRPMNGQPVPPRPVNGQPMPPRSMNGQPMPPRPMNGQPMPPRSMNGQPIPPRPMNGQPMPPRPMNGQPGPNQPQGTMVQRRPGMPPQARPAAAASADVSTEVQLKTKSRKMLKNPIFILIVLFQTICLAGSAAGILLDKVDIAGIITILENNNIPEAVMTYVSRIEMLINSAGKYAMIGMLSLKAPAVLIWFGLWLLILTAGTKKDRMSGAGFIFVKFGVVLETLLAIVVVLAGLLVSVTMLVSAMISGVREDQRFMVIVLGASIVVALMIIMYFFCLLHTIKVCKKNATIGDDYGKASFYAGLITILLGAICVIGLLYGIVNMEIFTIISFGGRVVSLVLLGFWIWIYKAVVRVKVKKNK